MPRPRPPPDDDAMTTATHSPAPAPYAMAGLAGAALSIVSWATMLGNPAQGTATWYAGNLLGEVAMIGTLVLALGLLEARVTGDGATGRGFLVLWALGLILLLAGGVQTLVTGRQDSILFPIGGITATLAALIGAIFIAANKQLAGTPLRWAPIAYASAAPPSR